MSRRNFIHTLGLSAAGMMLTSNGLANRFILKGLSGGFPKVAVTLADNYERTLIRQKVEHLFNALGGIGDVVKPGDKVAIKINITGGSSWANHPQLNGVDIRECAWTHPEVLRATGELLIDSGVTPGDIYFTEAIWDQNSYDNYGYKEVQDYLGTQLVNLNNTEPYSSFANMPSGSNHFYYADFNLNRILEEADVFVSIPKMKQHYSAGVTHSMKNLIGITPLSLYQLPSSPGSRTALHFEGGSTGFHLPRSICDLNLTRPVNLAVIDGVKNAIGGEGPWNDTFEPYENGIMLAGKDPVATDSIASWVMGNNPEASKLVLPGGGTCDNHLYLAAQAGMGTNIMNEIELVGDGAGSISGTHDGYDLLASQLTLYQNFPNPVRSKTTIPFFLPDRSKVTLKVINHSGQVINTLIDSELAPGNHNVLFSADLLPDGVYFYQIRANGYTKTMKMLVNSKQ